MQTTKQKITIELPEKISSNEFYNAHYHRRSPIKHEYYLAVKHALQESKTDKVVEYPVQMKFTFKLTGRLFDVSNCASMVKMIEDGLVQNKILEDDTNKYVNGICVFVERSQDKKNWVEIIL